MSAFELGIRSQTASRLAIFAAFILIPVAATAENFNAGAVMLKMAGGERYAFVAGVVEGLAISRYAQDGKKPEGMNCIYDWFYKDPKMIEIIYAAFERYPNYPPGSIVDALVRKACA